MVAIQRDGAQSGRQTAHPTRHCVAQAGHLLSEFDRRAPILSLPSSLGSSQRRRAVSSVGLPGSCGAPVWFRDRVLTPPSRQCIKSKALRSPSGHARPNEFCTSTSVRR
jgi:hypothetical protein